MGWEGLSYTEPSPALPQRAGWAVVVLQLFEAVSIGVKLRPLPLPSPSHQVDTRSLSWHLA